MSQAEQKGVLPSITPPNIFVGRKDATAFFVENILKSEVPTKKILAISGNGGVGKTTLLAQFIALAHAPEYNERTVTALVDERWLSPVNVLESFASQFSQRGHQLKKFEKELVQYKDGIQHEQAQQEVEHKALLDALAKMFGTAVELTPPGKFLGTVPEEASKNALYFFMKKYEEHQHVKEILRLDDPLQDLTMTFLDDLRDIIHPHSSLFRAHPKPVRQIVLFFDRFGRLAPTLAPWLLNYLLPNIDEHVALVLAGRAPIEVSTPDGYVSWQKYHDDQTLHCMALDNFTEEETQEYLKLQGITDPTQCRSIWEVSHGLPFYLSLLTSHAHTDIDPNESVVANLLSRIPEKEQVQRMLALEAALLSRSFNQDDLKSLPCLDGQDVPSLFDWLTAQPFVRHQGGPHYDELVQVLFCSHLHQTSPDAYYNLRAMLAEYYQRKLELLQDRSDQNVYTTPEWLELVLALIPQLLLSPDKKSHVKAVRYVIEAYTYGQRTESITKLLQKLSQPQPENLAPSSAQTIAQNLLICIGADLDSNEFLAADSYLLDRLQADHDPTFTGANELIAAILQMRGKAYIALHEYRQAICDLDQAIVLSSKDALEFGSRGFAHRLLKEYPQAIEDFTSAIALNPKYTWAYVQRALTYRYLDEYEQAIIDFNQALILNPTYAWAYGQRGKTYRLRKEYVQALGDFTQAIDVYPQNTWAYAQRGIVYLWMKHIQQAEQDFTHSWELARKHLNNGWISAWCTLCLGGLAGKAIERLAAVANIDPQHYVTHLCSGVTLMLQNKLAQAQSELEQVLSAVPGRWDAYFWLGMINGYLGNGDELVKHVEKAIELGLPPALLTPLQWLAQSKPDVYAQYIKPKFAL